MTSERPFAMEAIIVVLAVFALIEAASILGASLGPASIFVYPFNLVVSLVIVLSSLLGIYGVLTNSRMATYFSLLTPLVETILGFSFLLGVSSATSFIPILLPQGLLVVSLGVLGVFLVSKTLRQSAFLRSPRRL